MIRLLHIFLLTAFLLLTTAAPLYADTYNRARSLLAEGKYTAALEAFDSLATTNLPRRMKARVMDGKGLCLKARGLYPQALEAYNQALVNADATFAQAIFSHMAHLHLATGAYDDAIATLSRINHPDWTSMRDIDLANAYYRKGEVAKAHSLLLENVDSTGPQQAAVLQNLGYLHMNEGQPAKAVDYFHKALALMPQASASSSLTMGNLALALALKGDFDAALSTIDRTLAMQQQLLGCDHPDYIISLRKRANILLRKADLQEALKAYKKYYLAERGMLLSRFPGFTPQYRLDFWNAKKPLLAECFLLADTDPEFLFDVALFRRQVSLSNHNNDLLAKDVKTSRSDIVRALRPGEAVVEMVCYPNIDNTDTLYSALILSPQGKTSFVSLPSKKQLLATPIAHNLTLEKAILSDNRAHKNILYADSLLADAIWSPIEKAIPAHTQKLWFVPDGLLNIMAIEYLPHSLTDKTELRRLSSSAMLPLRSSKMKDLSGHNILLLGGIDYDNAGSPIQSSPDANHLARSYIDSHGGMRFPYLTGSRRERDYIASSINADTLSCSDFEEDVKRLLPGRSLIHLSTHGYALMPEHTARPLSMRDSVEQDLSLFAYGLALSGANRRNLPVTRDDGLLSAAEIADIDLSSTRLVVLSACRTAMGSITDEGPAGLLRGFKKAGAKSVIASLWSISDEATAIFMQRFYSELNNGKSISQAFAEARRHLRQDQIEVTLYKQDFDPGTMASTPSAIKRSKSFAAPYYWAPFILIDALD